MSVILIKECLYAKAYLSFRNAISSQYRESCNNLFLQRISCMKCETD